MKPITKLIIGIVFIALLIMIFKPPKEPLSVVFVSDEPEPNSISTCNQWSGARCIPISEECWATEESYGSCENNLRCCVKSMCLETGGKIDYELVTLNGIQVFKKTCVCPENYRYILGTGCLKIFK